MNQLCKVCAEPAAGFHFGAFTCEGCKSFFGRTYNNLSQIHECKNGGTCVINKQNRTSCKACRLRKCLYVGMSKSGSRYGRRSNWFKIHCLLQEQAGGLQNQSINLRAPVTPTLQDGSLPFVATQLREPGMGSDSPAVTTMNFSSTTTATCLSNPSLTTDIGSAARMLDVHRMGPTLPVNFSPLLLPGERNLQDKSGCRQPSSSPSSIESSYNEHLYNLIQRRHGIDSLWNATSLELDGESRRLSPDLENRLGPMAFLEWKKRLSEATKRAESSDHEKLKFHSPRRDDNENITEGSDDERKYDEFGKSELKCNTNSNAIKTEIKIDVESSDIQSKQKELLQRFKENEKLLTGNDSSLLAKTTTSFPLYTQPHEKINPLLKFPGREDMFYNPVRSNLFSFPPYPPLWPSIIPFTQFPKIYEPFCPPRLPNTANINCLKPPIFPLVNLPDSRNISPSIPKDDSNTKKRNLDAILQFQRENYSPNSSPDQRTYSPPSLTPPIPKTNPQFINTDPPLPNPPTDVPKNPSEQPIDLTVRRKRKMPKSEIVYKPEEVDDIVNESSKDCEDKVSDHLQIKVSEIKNSNLEDDFELPMKAIKLETTKETLAV